MKENKISIKVSPDNKEFLKNLKINRIKLIGGEYLSFSEVLSVIANYFKKNNVEYLDMLKENVR